MAEDTPRQTRQNRSVARRKSERKGTFQAFKWLLRRLARAEYALRPESVVAHQSL
jgi:hypothetical protein